MRRCAARPFASTARRDRSRCERRSWLTHAWSSVCGNSNVLYTSIVSISLQIEEIGRHREIAHV
eukprot:5385949-Pleurochrysis_carterae.AAC.2